MKVLRETRMREMLNPTSAIAGMGLASEVALVTDDALVGHPEGLNRHVSPEQL